MVRFSVGRVGYRRRVWPRAVNTGYLTDKPETRWGVSLICRNMPSWSQIDAIPEWLRCQWVRALRLCPRQRMRRQRRNAVEV